MNNGWQLISLDDVCEFLDRRGVTPKKLGSQFVSSGFRVISAKNIKERSIAIDVGEQRFVDEPTYRKWMKSPLMADDVLLTSEAPLGEPAYIAEDLEWCLGQRLFGIRTTKSKLYGRFLFYAMQSNMVQSDLLSRATGATAQGIRQAELKHVAIYLPPLPEQKRIVAILDEVFKGIGQAVTNAEKNLANARELFESYLNSVFTQKGEGWVEKSLSDVCSIISKLVDPRKPKFVDLPHIGAGNMVSMTGELVEVKTAREEKLKSGKFLFDENMVLYSKIRPYLMKASRPSFHGLCSADVYPLFPKDEQLNRDFLFYLLMSRHFTDYAIAGSDRAGMPKVNRKHLFRYCVSLPEVSKQKEIASQFDELSAEAQRLEAIYRQKLNALAELKQSILQKAFAGELTSETETIKEEVAA